MIIILSIHFRAPPFRPVGCAGMPTRRQTWRGEQEPTGGMVMATVSIYFFICHWLDNHLSCDSRKVLRPGWKKPFHTGQDGRNQQNFSGLSWRPGRVGMRNSSDDMWWLSFPPRNICGYCAWATWGLPVQSHLWDNVQKPCATSETRFWLALRWFLKTGILNIGIPHV